MFSDPVSWLSPSCKSCMCFNSHSDSGMHPVKAQPTSDDVKKILKICAIGFIDNHKDYIWAHPRWWGFATLSAGWCWEEFYLLGLERQQNKYRKLFTIGQATMHSPPSHLPNALKHTNRPTPTAHLCCDSARASWGWGSVASAAPGSPQPTRTWKASASMIKEIHRACVSAAMSGRIHLCTLCKIRFMGLGLLPDERVKKKEFSSTMWF